MFKSLETGNSLNSSSHLCKFGGKKGGVCVLQGSSGEWVEKLSIEIGEPGKLHH